MSKKRAKLPSADVLFGNSTSKQQNIPTLNSQDVKKVNNQDIKIATPTENPKEKQQKNKILKKQNIMTSCYFSPETVKEIEKAKVKLLIDYDLKVNKSQIVEAAVNNIINNLDQLSNILNQAKN